MNATIKHTIVGIIIIFAGLIAASNFVFAASALTDASEPRSEVRELSNVSDIAYAKPANLEFIQTSEPTIEEEATVEDEIISDEFYQEDIVFYSNGIGNAIYIAPGEHISAADFKYNGYYYDDSGFTYTYYPESALPGGALDIPGRHVNDEGYICDGDGNVCVASDNLSYGDVVNLPFGSGTGVVYDTGSGSGNLDIYTSW